MAKLPNTKVKLAEFNGKPIIQIWNADEKEATPLMAFGLPKAALILRHQEDIERLFNKARKKSKEQ